MSTLQLTEDEFDQQFTPVNDAQGDLLQPDHSQIDTDSKHLWSIVEGDDSDTLYAVTGVHRVNHLGYLLTKEVWDQPTTAVWAVMPHDEDDEEEAD